MITLSQDIESGQYIDQLYAAAGGGRILGAYRILDELKASLTTTQVQSRNPEENYSFY